jgi:hypothetical protein
MGGESLESIVALWAEILDMIVEGDDEEGAHVNKRGSLWSGDF